MPNLGRALAVFLLALPCPSLALGPNNVFIIANRNVAESHQVAEHYCLKRAVPRDHIILLDLPSGEDINRSDFNNKMRDPLRAALKNRRDQVKVLLTVYGVPLRVGRASPSDQEKSELAKVHKELEQLRTEQKRIQETLRALDAKVKKEPSESLTAQLKQQQQENRNALAKIEVLQRRVNWLNHAESEAAVDSELMLLWWDNYELRKWQPNLLNFRVPDKARAAKPPILMVSRLDGPSAALARRLVDDAVEVEKKGLSGKVYVDARGIKHADVKNAYGYSGYDESLREMAKLLREDAKLPVVLDDKGELFPPDSCPNAALYCGWYSLANYVPSCKFVKGAVAYHIASAEAVSLRNPKSKFWCPRLLQDGAAATLGPVAEPYTIGFPKPAEFFGLLATGEYTLVECYSKTLLLNSWMTVLVGDPLYNPFRASPRLRADQVNPSPRGTPFIFRFPNDN
jgi:uncharacterized protein (TIGR03790 family)